MSVVKTYEDWSGQPLKSKEVRRGPKNDNTVSKFECDFCGTYSWAFVLVDVSHLPKSFRGKKKFACDGCRETWRRDNIDFETGKKNKSHWRDNQIGWNKRFLKGE